MKNKCNPDDAAFSNAVDHYDNPTLGYGLTKREYFAALAFQGLCATIAPEDDYKELSRIAIKLADALIEELNK